MHLRSHLKRHFAAAGALMAAFGVGMALGDLSWSSRFLPHSESAVARYFTPRPKEPHVERAPSLASAKSKRLRLRPTTSLSSGQARPGDPVLFLTEQWLEDVSGYSIPAGSLVEAVVAEAESAHGSQPGKLVIEIRTLHVGSKAIALEATPYSLRTAPAPITPPDMAPALAGRALYPKPKTPEAVVALESVLEFELIETKPVPVAEPVPAVAPKAPTEPAESPTRPASPGKPAILDKPWSKEPRRPARPVAV